MDWQIELQELVIKHSHTGAQYDVAGMTEDERWGLLRHLRRIDSESEQKKPDNLPNKFSF